MSGIVISFRLEFDCQQSIFEQNQGYPIFFWGIFGTVTVTSKESPMNKLSELEVCDFD